MATSSQGGSGQLSQIPSTPVNEGGRVPPGCLVASWKWKGSELLKALQGKLKVLMEDKMGVVDFYSSDDAAVVYVSEMDLVIGSAFKLKLAKLRKASGIRGIVIAECTPLSEQYLANLQKFVVLELGLRLLVIASQTEAATLLIQMVSEEHKPHANPFLVKRQRPLIDSSVLTTVHHLPGVGPVKAKQLLQEFGSIRGLSQASEEDLSRIMGKAKASTIRAFFKIPTTAAQQPPVT